MSKEQVILTKTEAGELWDYIQTLRERIEDLAYDNDVEYVVKSKSVTSALNKLVV